MPELALSSRSRTAGQTSAVRFGPVHAFTEQLEVGLLDRCRCDSGEINGPIEEAVTACGWTYRGVAFG